jgi:hypothetical protein
MDERARIAVLAASLAAVVAVGACRATGGGGGTGATLPSAASPGPLVTASPVPVTVPVSTSVIDPADYRPGAWLAAADLPFPALRWQLVRTTNSRYDDQLTVPQSTCAPLGHNPPAGPATDPAATLTQVFWGMAGRRPNGHVEQPIATESQYFYPDTAGASAAFRTWVAAFAGCVAAAGTAVAPGTDDTGHPGPVTHNVVRTATGPVDGAWVHQVRFADGTPAESGFPDSYMYAADSHYYVVVRGNLMDTLELFGTSAIDPPETDPATVAAIGRHLAAYDRSATPANLPVDNAGALWQASLPPQALPAAPKWRWRQGGGTSVENSATGSGGPLGNVACTPVTEGEPDDGTLRLNVSHGYDALPPYPPPAHRYLQGWETLLRFTTPALARAAFDRLDRDMKGCAAALSGEQRANSLPTDASVDALFHTASTAVWTITATGFDIQSARILTATVAPVEHRTSHILLLVRGAFVVVVALTGDDASTAVFTTATDAVVLSAAGGALCNLQNVCG